MKVSQCAQPRMPFLLPLFHRPCSFNKSLTFCQNCHWLLCVCLCSLHDSSVLESVFKWISVGKQQLLWRWKKIQGWGNFIYHLWVVRAEHRYTESLIRYQISKWQLTNNFTMLLFKVELNTASWIDAMGYALSMTGVWSTCENTLNIIVRQQSMTPLEERP